MHYEIEHNLGQMPRFWQFYLSFDRAFNPDGGELAPASGNQAELRSIDETKMIVVNGSCVDYWLLVIAGIGQVAPVPADDPALPDAGADADPTP
jgi:hypothetical protein